MLLCTAELLPKSGDCMETDNSMRCLVEQGEAALAKLKKAKLVGHGN